jgi:molybdate transport system substrate-binding protein
VAAAVAVALITGACGEPRSNPEGPGAITIFAAASLTEAFTRLGDDFQSAHPGTRVTFNFAGSAQLATQINEGAPADVFAAASPATMKTVTDAGNADGAPVVFARNQLVIAVPNGNPEGITGLADLTRPGLKVALCAEQVPCGAAAGEALDDAAVPLTPVTLEQDVKAALSKLKLGEVDAALVYRTDARAAPDDVDGIEFPESAGVVNDYPVVVVRDAPNRTTATAFLAYVRSPPGVTVLTGAGFQAP